ncbi:sensor histidine kinase [Saccharothrix hoggarensis]|uniref:histidine kinase n=1 Tax=Saccharothrix hoggarensis TaxID=913853 RepID=A0ABW3R2N4_9PSEU
MSLRTVSLRRRVALSAIGVLGAVLIGVVLVVDGLFAAQSKRDVETALLEKARVAQQLVMQGVRGANLVNRLQGRGVEVRLVMPDGAVFGAALDEEVANGTTRDLPDGSKITLYAESSVITAAQVRLRRLLLLVGFGAVAVTAAAMVWVVRRALAPLDAMTTLARNIARGDRGHRLNPSRSDNELGRTAAAFDDMLDSLEGSEERTKRFVADAAHELRTPIAGVQAVAEALMQTAGAEERERLNLLLVRESRRAGRLVDDLLALARIEAGLELHRERVDLLALAEAEVGRTRLLAPDFDIAAEGESAFVSGDPQRLAQVLANLADNARQATGPSGRVRLRVSRTGAIAHLTVSDNGPGVAPEDRERIFDRLVRLDEARDRRSGGSGLGLPIARGVVRAHGGELTCVDPHHLTGSTRPNGSIGSTRSIGSTGATVAGRTDGPVAHGLVVNGPAVSAGQVHAGQANPAAGAGQPDAGQAGAERAAVEQVAAECADTEQAGAGRVGAGQTGAGLVGAKRFAAGQTAAGRVGAGQAGAERPAAGQVGRGQVGGGWAGDGRAEAPPVVGGAVFEVRIPLAE